MPSKSTANGTVDQSKTNDRETVPATTASAIAAVTRSRPTPERTSAPGFQVDEPYGRRQGPKVKTSPAPIGQLQERRPAFDPTSLDTPRLRPARERFSTLEIMEPDERPKGAGMSRSFVTVNVASASGAASFHVLGEGTVTIGRDAGNTIEVNDAGASGQHARIVFEDGEYLLEDLFSTNGTYVNGVRVNRHRVADGDRIQFGRSAHLTIRYQDAVELEAAKKLHDSVTRDPLTGVLNRRNFQERLMSEWAFATRHKTSLTLMMIDLDHFKRINDEYGHLGGDAVLVSFSSTLASFVRSEDIVARYGGEEFAILARSLDEEQAYFFAERIRAMVESMEVPFRASPIHVTSSIGVATTSRQKPHADPRALLESADAALYKAKRIGRNRVVTA